MAEINYVDGKLEGAATAWRVDGSIMHVTNHEKGEKNGLSTDYYKSGEKESEVNYVDDKKNGLETEWNEDGSIKSETNYKDGVVI